ncbi:ABC transporter permease [candidate division KSB1 bacterium]
MKTENKKPDKLAEYLLYLTLPESESSFLLGDYEEEFNFLREQKGVLYANIRYWILVLESIPGFIINSFYLGFDMFKNYLKIAVRNIKKQKSYSFINISGLAIGMACCILILLWVRDELSFDRFHKNTDRLYRIVCEMHLGDAVRYTESTPAPLGKALKENFPEIQLSTMYYDIGRANVRRKEKIFREENFGFVERDFFAMFSFPLIKGSINSVFSNPYSVVLSESMADKYFKGEEPIGKTLTIDNQYDVLVTGVMKNFPDNSSIKADFLSPFEIALTEYYGPDMPQNWGSHTFATYLMLGENSSIQDVISNIYNYKKEKIDPESSIRFIIQPLKKIHLYSKHISDSIFSKGDIIYVYLFTALAILILLIACINFMNLITARSGSRLREVGMRKVVGASKRNIVRQFFGETLLLSFLALIISIILVYLILPEFNSLSRKNLSLFSLDNLTVIFWLAGIALLTGIVSGSYPAFFISSFEPVKILKGTISSASRGLRLRTILVISQFTLSIILIIGAIALSGQLDFLRKKDLGYNKDHVISISMSTDAGKRYNLFKKELSRIPGVMNVTGSFSPIVIKQTAISGLGWEGGDPNNTVRFWMEYVDYDYTETLDIKLAEGRSFSKEFSSDITDVCLINEEAVRQMGIESPVGKNFEFDNNILKIVGVMKDFNFNPLHSPVEPIILRFNPSRLSYTHVKIKPDNISAALGLIEKSFKKINPDDIFRYRFVDAYFDLLYRSEQRIKTIFHWSAILGVFISCMGLIGLASYVTQKRTKEIGIRKVLGASETGLMLLMIKEFIIWVIIANLLAWPTAWYAINKLFENFAYRIEAGWMMFIIPGLFALVLAIVTVSVQTIKAVRSKPVDTLRYE